MSTNGKITEHELELVKREDETTSHDDNLNDSEREESADSDPDEVPDRLGDNESVALCLQAWHLRYKQECAGLGEKDSDYGARREACKAFLDCLPPLAGYDNVRDFIACVTQAYLWDLTGEKRTARLFSAVKLALSALRLEPQLKRSAGRPRKKNGLLEVI